MIPMHSQTYDTDGYDCTSTQTRMFVNLVPGGSRSTRKVHFFFYKSMIVKQPISTGLSTGVGGAAGLAAAAARLAFQTGGDVGRN